MYTMCTTRIQGDQEQWTTDHQNKLTRPEGICQFLKNKQTFRIKVNSIRLKSRSIYIMYTMATQNRHLGSRNVIAIFISVAFIDPITIYEFYNKITKFTTKTISMAIFRCKNYVHNSFFFIANVVNLTTILWIFFFSFFFINKT